MYWIEAQNWFKRTTNLKIKTGRKNSCRYVNRHQTKTHKNRANQQISRDRAISISGEIIGIKRVVWVIRTKQLRYLPLMFELSPRCLRTINTKLWT